MSPISQRTPDRFRMLLTKYMKHVLSARGVSFVEESVLRQHSFSSGELVKFTAEELKELQAIQVEIEVEGS